jgi:hypothetical protein
MMLAERLPAVEKKMHVQKFIKRPMLEPEL